MMKRAVAGVTIAAMLFVSLALAPESYPAGAPLSLTGGLCIGAVVDLLSSANGVWGAFGDRVLFDEFGLPLPVGRAGDMLRYWENGQTVSPGDYNPGVDIESVMLRLFLTEVVFEFFLLAASPAFPIFLKMAIDRSATVADSRCVWCRALDLFGPQTVYGQTITNPFMGPGMSEDFVLFAQIDGPGRGSLFRLVGTATRPLAGTVQMAGNRVTFRIPLAVAIELGVARPGVRLVFGAVGPPPKSVYDRVPKQGSVQVGLRGQMEIDPAPLAKEKFELAGSRDVLYYLDTNGNGLIDAIARDADGDGRISFLRSEGPVLLLGTGNQPIEFSGVQQKTVGNRRAFLALAGQVAYLTVVQDTNSDGDVSDEGEFRSYLVRR